MSFALHGVKKWLTSSTINGASSSQRCEGFKTYQEGATELFPYTRPAILGLSKEATKASADHELRPILIVHRELPLNTGYAETINAGKTCYTNEDQAFAENYCLKVINNTKKTMTTLQYWCFGIFDGHAGPGAALAAVNQLPDIIHGKIHEIQEIIVSEENAMRNHELVREAVVPGITLDSLITGVLEKSFVDMDNGIKRDKKKHIIAGGCTAVVSLFIRNKLFVANAGDSRAVLCKDWKPIPLSSDHTPETDRNRLQTLASQTPKLLGDEFTRLEFQQKPRRKHIGKKLLYRDKNMTGWALKEINEEDVMKTQMIFGSGKSARLLETIGTTRGFGDFDLAASYTGIPVKPFLTPEPDVTKYDLIENGVTENDVLIMATDGLWEKVSNEKACTVVKETLQQCNKDDPKRYVVAAQNLVLAARGQNTGRGWRIAKSKGCTNDFDLKSGDPGSYDDISVLVIPISNSINELLVQQYPLNSELTNVEKLLYDATLDSTLEYCTDDVPEHCPASHDKIRLSLVSLDETTNKV